MNTPTDIRNAHLAEHLIKSLRRRHIEARYCATAREAVDSLLEQLPAGSSITWGGSMTLRDMGIPAALHASGNYELYDRDLAADREEAQAIYRQAFHADYYLSSANALTEDGVIVNIDGTGNRVAAITFGPRHVIFVIGLNKVAQTVEAALARARSMAAPVNTARFNINTPCKVDGVCHHCCSEDCICNFVHFLRHSPQGRHSVILVGESLGY